MFYKYRPLSSLPATLYDHLYLLNQWAARREKLMAGLDVTPKKPDEYEFIIIKDSFDDADSIVYGTLPPWYGNPDTMHHLSEIQKAYCIIDGGMVIKNRWGDTDLMYDKSEPRYEFFCVVLTNEELDEIHEYQSKTEYVRYNKKSHIG